jgi:hypothetical protein
MPQIERTTVIIGGDTEFVELLPNVLRMQARANANSVFNLDTDREDAVAESLGLKLQEVDMVLDVDTLIRHRDRVFALLKRIVEQVTPELCSIQAVYRQDMNAGFLSEVLRFCAEHQISCTIIPAAEVQGSGEPSSLRRLLATGPYNVVEMIIDRSSVPETQFLRGSRTFIPTGLPQTLLHNKIVDEQYWYWDEKGAALWLYLKDSKNYPFFAETYELLQSNVARIRDIVFERLSKDRSTTIDIVTLGVGSAEKELLLIRAILDEPKRRRVPVQSPMYYIPLDISFPLLQNSIRIMFSDSRIRERIEKRNFVVRPVLTDFLRTPGQLIATPNESKVITALGLLTNVPRADALIALRNLMTDNMLLLIDAELIGGRKDSELIKEYSGDEVNDFLYHPVDMLCGSTRGESFRTEVKGRLSEVSYDCFNGYREGAGKIEVDVVDDDNLSALEAKWGVPEAAVRGFGRLSDSQNSKVIVIMFKPADTSVTPIILGYSTKYEYRELKECLTTSGFELIGEYLNNASEPIRSSFGYFLLRKT